MLSVTEKYLVFCADLSGPFGTYEDLMNTPLRKIEEYRAASIICNVLKGG